MSGWQGLEWAHFNMGPPKHTLAGLRARFLSWLDCYIRLVGESKRVLASQF